MARVSVVWPKSPLQGAEHLPCFACYAEAWLLFCFFEATGAGRPWGRSCNSCESSRVIPLHMSFMLSTGRLSVSETSERSVETCENPFSLLGTPGTTCTSGRKEAPGGVPKHPPAIQFSSSQRVEFPLRRASKRAVPNMSCANEFSQRGP